MADKEKIIQELERFEKNQKVKISDNAKDLIIIIIDSIESDPHRKWNQLNFPSRGSFKMMLIRTLPNFLNNIIESEKVRSEITTYDVLHWMSLNLSSYCPIKK